MLAVESGLEDAHVSDITTIYAPLWALLVGCG